MGRRSRFHVSRVSSPMSSTATETPPTLAACTGAGSQPDHGILHGGSGAEPRRVRRRATQWVPTNGYEHVCCSKAQEHKYITSRATKKTRRPKTYNGVHQRKNKMTWINIEMAWTPTKTKEELSDGGTKTNHTTEKTETALSRRLSKKTPKNGAYLLRTSRKPRTTDRSRRNGTDSKSRGETS